MTQGVWFDMAKKVGSKGQVVIDKKLRDELGIEPGFFAIQRRVGDRVEIRFVPGEHDRSLAGALADEVRRRPGADEDWQEVERRAWEAAAQERAAESDES